MALEQMWGLRGQVTHSDDDFCLSANGAQLTLAACDAAAPAQSFTWWPKAAACSGSGCAGPAAPVSEVVGVGCTATGSLAAGWLSLLAVGALRRPRAVAGFRG